MEIKVCSKCGAEKPVTEFYKMGGRRNQLRSECKQCTKAKNATYYARTIDDYHAKRQTHREQNREYFRDKERVRYDQLRQEMLAAFGGTCACCGESEPLFLELDHINDDGFRHRKLIGRGAKATYQWAKEQGWPTDTFQLLCANCNQGKKRNDGICPHKR